MRLSAFYFLVCIYLTQTIEINCWKDFEPDLFDLVEEVGQNFYEFFDINKNADNNEIRKAYRKLSLKYHPDKNSEADAEDVFRKIVGIYEVLKDEEKRKRYDEILEFGLPDWKEPIYYYRRARKLSITELLISISVVIVIGHYFVMWAQYFENRLNLDERISETRKKLEKKQKKQNKKVNMDEIDKVLDEAYNMLPSPSLKNTLPIRFVLWLYSNKLFLPFFYVLLKEKLSKKAEIIESDYEDDDAEVVRAEAEKARRRLVNDLNPKKVENSNLSAPVIPYNIEKSKTDNEEALDDSSQSKKSLDNWTDAEKALLIKAITRYPGGTPDRWNTISKYVNRPVQQCIQMDKNLRNNLKVVATQIQNRNLNIGNGESLISDDIMTQREFDTNNTTNKANEWNQEQQKQLEDALKAVSKDVSDRWDKIAELVPGKTKDECMLRFKALCQALNKTKK